VLKTQTLATIIKAWRKPDYPTILRIRFSFVCPECGTKHHMEDASGEDLPVTIGYAVNCCSVGDLQVVFQTLEAFTQDTLTERGFVPPE
jgi:hypothetical protein